MWGFARDMFPATGPRWFLCGSCAGTRWDRTLHGGQLSTLRNSCGRENCCQCGYGRSDIGGASKLLVYPLDTVKKRLQVQAYSLEIDRYKGTVDCLLKIVKQEGVGSLYRGIVPSVMKNTIATSLSFSLYILSYNTFTGLTDRA